MLQKLCLSLESDLRVLEIKIIITISGPIKEEDDYRAIMNHDIFEKMGAEDIVKLIKAQSIKRLCIYGEEKLHHF